jgi:hypothetical protein
MERDEVRKLVEETFYKSLTETGVEVTAIPATQLRAMVRGLADGVFAVLDAWEAEDEIPVPPARTSRPSAGAPVDPDISQPAAMSAAAGGGSEAHQEELIWRGRPYLTIGTRYELTNERIRIIRGILGKHIEEIELVRVKDTKVSQHMGERMLNIGDIAVISADPATPEFLLRNVPNPIDVRELIRSTMMQEKARRGLYYREDISGEEVV